MLTNWRDVRTTKQLQEWSEWFNNESQTEKEAILLEMSVFMGKENAIAREILEKTIMPRTEKPLYHVRRTRRRRS